MVEAELRLFDLTMSCFGFQTLSAELADEWSSESLRLGLFERKASLFFANWTCSATPFR